MEEILLIILFLVGLVLFIRMGEYHAWTIRLALIFFWIISYSGGVIKLYS